MNKIYKVIWSKVKNQYVVVSELAHSNGKQSRTSRNSIRSRIAALVVCGAIAAFGVFSALPMDSVYAAENVNVAKANEYQYVAIKTTDEGSVKSYTDSTGKTYTYHSEFINGAKYWVRDGYTIEQIEGKRFPEAQKTAQIQAIKSPNASTEGLLQSNRVLLSTPGQSTVLGDTLQKADVGVYMGATNEGGTKTPSSWNYYIQKNDGSYVDAGGANFDTYFVEAEKQNDGTYTVNGKTVSSENLYVINDQNYLYTNAEGKAVYEFGEDSNNFKLGAFVVDGQIYTKNVFGKYNEVLMSAQQGNTYYSYWAADTYDADAPMQLTQGQYKDIVDTMWGNDAYLASSDVSKIKLEKVPEENKKGGTISLLQQGDYNSETNSYENNKTLPGAITVTSEGGTGGKDVAIRFSNEDNLDGFTVDAGSKVVGKITTKNGLVEEAGVDDANKTLTGLKINGVDYVLSQGKTYDKGDGISIDENTNKISIALAKDGDQNVSGLHFNEKDELVNDLQVKSYKTPTSTTNKDGGNWTITKTDENGESVNLTNTTLDTNASSAYNYNESKDNLIKGDKDTSYENTEYGRNYKVIDTDGNEVELKNVASATTLKTIDTTKIGDLKYNDFTKGDSDTTSIVKNNEDLTTAVGKLDNAVNEAKTEAGKHTKMTVNGGIEAIENEYTDGNLQLKETEENGQTTYDVKLNDNITLGEKEENQININGNPEAGEAALSIGDKFVVEQNGSVSIKADNTETYGIDTTVTVNPDGVKFEKYGNGTTVINGQTIQAGGVVINGEDNGVYKGTITGLTNTTLDDETFATVGRAATEEQLKQAAAASKTTLSDGVNTTVTSNDNTPDGHVDYQVNLNDNVYLGGNNKPGSSNIELDGENGTIQVGSNIILDSKEARAIIGGVDISTTFDDIGKKSSTITGLSNTTWDTDKVVIDRAATEGQLQMVSDKVTAGWTATDDAGNKINVNPETRPTLNFASGKNITVSANEDSGEVEVSLNDNINLNDRVYINGDPEEGNNTIVDIKSSDTSKEESIFAVEDKGNGSISIGGIDITNVDGPYLAVGDGKLKFYKDGGLSTGNATGTFSVRPDGDLEISGKNSSFDVDAETGNINAENNSGSSIKMDGNGTTIAVNDGTVMGNNTTMTVNKDGVSFSAYGNGTTVIDGQTIYAGGVVINNNGSGTINGLTNTTWDDELAKQVANNEELQSTAATQGQLQQAVSEVAEVANAGWNAKAGGNTINVKPNETLNFEGDGNITVSATSGTSSELKFGLNHNITLDNVENEKTMMVFNTDGREGYIPDNYKEDNGQINDFIEEHGGFAIYYANPSLTTGDMTGTFGVTTDGVVHAKDVISYYSASSGSQSDVIRYSLNDVGDIVTQISHAVFDEGVGKTGMEYTLISDFEDEADKDSPFDAKEGKTRTIGLAVRQDGAVIVGAVVNDEGISSDRGIRINAETKTTYDKNGNEVTNNIATITGLENTEWKPKAPEQTPQAKMATFAANDETTITTTTTSRAATEAQLDDLYNVVSVYNTFDNNGNVNYNTIKLRGDEYSYNEKNPVDSKGTSITNVAYASGKDGSEAVNVDYLNDAINNAVKDGGAISDSDRHLQEGTYHVNDQGKVELIVADEKGENQSTVTIDNIANKNDITNLDNKIDNTFNDLNDRINNIDNVETDVKGGNINEDGTISLKTENEDGTTTNVTLKGQLTDSGVVQEGTSFDKETGTITITSQDKYSGETSSVKVEGIASTEVVGATNKEDLATAYKDADKDGNATTEYITDSESMVEADVALDHAIQDVAGTSYANDMVLSNRIDSVEKRLGNVEERIDKVGAMAAAIANLRTMGFDPEAPTEIAIGVGQYKSETGIAIGVFHYPNQDFMLSASLSSSGDELMGGIGATWKLGRKSAAERAKDEEARHLEQAEEMKKLAQQEKVKAQAQRHAKLLAERQQASQKNA